MEPCWVGGSHNSTTLAIYYAPYRYAVHNESERAGGNKESEVDEEGGKLLLLSSSSRMIGIKSNSVLLLCWTMLPTKVRADSTSSEEIQERWHALEEVRKRCSTVNNDATEPPVSAV